MELFIHVRTPDLPLLDVQHLIISPFHFVVLDNYSTSMSRRLRLPFVFIYKELTKITEVNLSAFIYICLLFHEDFSSIIGM